jgi:hypothetical protein
MNWTGPINGFVRSNEASIILASSAAILCLIIFNLVLSLKLRRLSKRTKQASAKADDSPIGDIHELARRLEMMEEQAVLLGERDKVLDDRIGRTIQKTGLVRFDAFPDVGGEQSFALAMLDRDMTGIVLSSLYSRSDSRVYAKEITEGRSPNALSNEELDALKRAGVVLK